MGKKHKKHHRSDKTDYEEEREEGSRDEKPLKLVLKVGNTPVGTPDSRDNEDDNPERKHKHKKKKKHHKRHDSPVSIKREKRKHDQSMEVSEEEEEEPAVAPPPKRSVRELSVKEGVSSALAQTLDYLHKTLQRRDQNGFFAYPVTDAIAPLYSSIISAPMDFSTVRSKLDNDEYETVAAFRNDFKLMCDNAMTYNHPDTIYYKEAKKLLQWGLKQMTKEKMSILRRTVAFAAELTEAELGSLDDLASVCAGGEAVGGEGAAMQAPLAAHSTAASQQPAPQPRKPKKPKPSKFEAIPDRMSAEAILAQARAAAREAADNLTLRKPTADLGFLRRRPDGSTSLTVLNTDNGGRVGPRERIVDLGGLIGKVTAGAGVLMGLREDKRNRANPVSYLNYGAFATYAPAYDSTTANVSKQESDLLLATYGDSTGVEYSKSLREFVGDTGDYAVRMVDNLLDILTQGEHSATRAFCAQKEEERQREEEQRRAEEDERRRRQEEQKQQTAGSDYDFESLRSLSDLGIDVSFLDDVEKQLDSPGSLPPTTAQIQARLDQTAAMLAALQQTQQTRLQQKLPPHLALVPGPTEQEAKLAEKVITKITSLLKQTKPAGVTSTNVIRKAMGIGTKPSNMTPSEVATSDDDDQSETATHKEEAEEGGDESSERGGSVDNDLDAVLDDLEIDRDGSEPVAAGGFQ